MRTTIKAAMLLVTVCSAVLGAQSFDAASIKESPDANGTGGGMRVLPSGDIRVQHMRTRFLITIANQIEPYTLVDAPGWTDTTFYDINARANASVTREQTFAMMRALLADRFKLITHRETRAVRGFALVRASDRLGSGLVPSTVNCEVSVPRQGRCAEGGITPTSFTAFGIPLANFVQLLASQLAAPLVDETRLTGTFDVALRWTNDAATGDDAPVISTAIREQLGLRLERRSIPLEVLVVDHIEKPTPD
jgi:uncharacterized protein (TIGR03435 family)